MPEQNLLTLQQYATKHKMSTFAVIKLVNQKKLKTVKKREHEEDVEYIVDDSLPTKPLKAQEEEKSALQTSSIDYEVEFHKLLAKYIDLQEKYTTLIKETKSVSN